MNVTGCRCRSEAAASRLLQWLQRRHGEWGRFRGTSPRMRMTASWWVLQEATEYKVLFRHRPRTLAGCPFDRHEAPSIKRDGHAGLWGIDGRKNAHYLC